MANFNPNVPASSQNEAIRNEKRRRSSLVDHSPKFSSSLDRPNYVASRLTSSGLPVLSGGQHPQPISSSLAAAGFLANPQERLSANQLDVATSQLVSQYSQMQIESRNMQDQLRVQQRMRRHSATAVPMAQEMQQSEFLPGHGPNLNFYYSKSGVMADQSSSTSAPYNKMAIEKGSGSGKSESVDSGSHQIQQSGSSTNQLIPRAQTCRSPSLKDDIDIVFNRLMSLEAFRKMHPSLIRNLCSYASVERIDKGVIGKLNSNS